MQNLENDVLETLNRELFLRVMQKALTLMNEWMSKEEIAQILNEVDESGATLIHYVTALDYHELINILYANGCDINAKITNNITPLVIAVANNFIKSVKQLIRLGATFWNEQDDD